MTLHALALGASGLGAGILGALLGLGGGIILVPVLNLLFHVPLPQAVAASLVSVIATSSGAAAAYVKDHYSDIRLGMTLELATTSGALTGSIVAALVPVNALRWLFAAFVTYVAFTLVRGMGSGDERDLRVGQGYAVRRLPLGLAGSFVAGNLSGALGVGGGPIKVPLMHLAMDVPFKIATATSNFMIGVTAAASVFVYFRRGDLDLAVAAPVMVGVLIGAVGGARVMPRVKARPLKIAFAVVLLLIAAEMAQKALHGGSA